MPVIFADKLKTHVLQILQAAGVDSRVAERTAQHLVDANLAGVDSHGVLRIPDYIDLVKRGRIARDDRIEVVRDQGAIVLLDGHYTFGQLTAWRATEMAIDKARQFGIGLVSVRNSAHIGRLGEYAERMALEGMIGLICGNLQGGGQRVAPWGGREGRFGTNPLAWSAPTSGVPIVIDISTAVSAEGKIRVKMRRGEQLPPNWLLDSLGEPTTNPADLYGPPFGAILTTGGHKGYGLSLIIEAMTGALSGGGVSHAASDIDSVENAVAVIAINIASFETLENFVKRTDALVAHMKTARPIEPDGEVLIPYEPESRERQRRTVEGIYIEDDTWQRIVATARSVGLDL